MTKEQQEARKKSAESGNINWIKKNCLRTSNDGDDYVFISYKSDDFEKVLNDIVYKTCKKYGLRVYFDTAFDENPGSWIKQYYDNMHSCHCKAFIAFLDNAYYSSYACLLEMMTSRTRSATGDLEDDSMFFIPINIGTITHQLDDSNTGLGTKRNSNGVINNHASDELKKFNDVFKEVAKNEKCKKIKKYYKPSKDSIVFEEATNDSIAHGEMLLNITQCRKIMESVIKSDNENNGDNKSFIDVIHDKLWNGGITSVFDSTIPAKTSDNSSSVNNEETEIEIEEKAQEKEKSELSEEEYKYTIFGKEYTAIKGEQGKLMSDVFSALVNKHPDMADSLTSMTSVSKKENVSNPNTQEAKPPYFRKCYEFPLKNNTFLVGTSYGLDAKLTEIKGMLKICGEAPYEFVLNGKPLADGKVYGNKDESDVNNTNVNAGQTANCFIYQLWNIQHKADKLSDMMHNVFDLIAQKYPEKILDMARNNRITSVALKCDVNEQKLPPTKLGYFKVKKEHIVGETSYYVSTRYSRENGIEQLDKMLTICEGNSDNFVITSAPDKSSRIVNGKKGLREFL